jgi:hypothetical protein
MYDCAKEILFALSLMYDCAKQEAQPSRRVKNGLNMWQRTKGAATNEGG